MWIGALSIGAFCEELRRTKTLDGVRDLLKQTGAAYSVVLHKPNAVFSRQERAGYFGGLTPTKTVVAVEALSLP